MNAEQRRFTRTNAVIDGAFRCLDGNAQGALMLTDRSRGGIRATLTQALEPGKRIECGIHMPEQSLPVFTTGTVMWVRAKPRESTFGFDAGIRWDSFGLLDNPQIEGFRFTPWRMRHIAAFASQRGYYARRFPDTHAKSSYFLPSLWTGYVLAGGISALMFPRWLPVFAATLVAGLVGVLFEGLRRVGAATAGGSLAVRLQTLAALCISKPLVYLEYGIFFLRGFVSRHLPRDAR